MAGGKSLGENYAFAGMHHVFDQHAEAGGYFQLSPMQFLEFKLFHKLLFAQMGHSIISFLGLFFF
jgi:hypothetical protein